jgi:hypothetical protein
MVLCRSLPPSYQLLGDFGLSLQPRQPRLLVHASHLLARRWRMTAMTWRLAAAFCSSAQGRSLIIV